MRRVIVLVGFLADERLNSFMVENYVARAIKHYHENDPQGTFSGGLNSPCNVAVVKTTGPDLQENIKGIDNFFIVMNRLKD